jgi:hypothetical protein
MKYVEFRPYAKGDSDKFHPKFIVLNLLVEDLSKELPVTVAEDRRKGLIVGYIAPRRLDPETNTVVFDGGYGCCINVAPEYRHNGIGIGLLGAEESSLMRQGIEGMVVSHLHQLRIHSPSYTGIYPLAPKAISRLYSSKSGWVTTSLEDMNLRSRIPSSRLKEDPGLLEFILNESYGIPLQDIRSVPWEENPTLHQVTITKRKNLV